MAQEPSKEPSKISTRPLIALIEGRKLRKAGRELKKLEPMRAQIYGYDRLALAIHGPVAKAEKAYFEAQALVPEFTGQGAGDPATRGSRVRSAVRRLMKARSIIRDAPEINDLLKQCLATLQEAENKVSAAQGLAMRGDYAAAYKEIKAAAELDDSPEVKETRKLIATHYKAQTNEAESVRRTKRIAMLGVAVLMLAVIGVLMVQCHFRSEVDDVRRDVDRQKKLAASGVPVVTAPPPSAPVETPVAPPAPTPANPAATPPTPPVTAGPATPPPVVAPPAEAPAPTGPQPVEIKADAPAGTLLGALPPGTKITLRYKEGVWMPWRNKAGFSPDVPSEAGKRHCLAIRGINLDGTTKLLQVVPFHTKETPFTYEVIGKYDALALVMNDDDGNWGNNDGLTIYDLTVVKP